MQKFKDNFNSTHYDPYKFIENVTRANKKVISVKLDISLEDYQDKSEDNIFFSFFKEEKKDLKNEDDLIISIKQDNNNNYLAQTGNYVGKFVWNGLEIDIKSRFSTSFLERMLNFANDIYLDDVFVSGKNLKEDIDISKYIIYYMFVQNLEKSFLLGLPKAYRSINHHEMKLKGKIDINRFIKYDIPFQGKVSSTSREQKEIQEIIDTLYKAIKIIDKSSFSTKNISHIKTHLKQNRSNKYVSNEIINKAMKSKALQNPIFVPYKKVLEYARFIINGDNIEQNKDGKNDTYGFLINVAELFEIYVTKLLQKEFDDWNVDSPQLRLDKEFGEQYLYNRRIIPDITMIHKYTKNVMVFDTKYKRMLFRKTKGNGSDIGRNDFFQINTYMNYYNNQDRYNLLVGGLLYPIEKEFDTNFAHSNNWFGSNTKFVVDGINLFCINDDSTILDMKLREDAFVARIRKLIEGNK